MEQEIELNENDGKLIGFCFNQRRTVADISRELKIAPKNVSVRLPKLKEAGLIKITPIGNKTYVRSIQGDKTKEYFLEILKKLQDEGGFMKENDYYSLLPFTLDNIDDRDRKSAPLTMMFSRPKLVERYVKISPSGEEFLKQNE